MRDLYEKNTFQFTPRKKGQRYTKAFTVVTPEGTPWYACSIPHNRSAIQRRRAFRLLVSMHIPREISANPVGSNNAPRAHGDRNNRSRGNAADLRGDSHVRRRSSKLVEESAARRDHRCENLTEARYTEDAEENYAHGLLDQCLALINLNLQHIGN